jgi:hypothetical protein
MFDLINVSLAARAVSCARHQRNWSPPPRSELALVSENEKRKQNNGADLFLR